MLEEAWWVSSGGVVGELGGVVGELVALLPLTHLVPGSNLGQGASRNGILNLRAAEPIVILYKKNHIKPHKKRCLLAQPQTWIPKVRCKWMVAV